MTMPMPNIGVDPGPTPESDARIREAVERCRLLFRDLTMREKLAAAEQLQASAWDRRA